MTKDRTDGYIPDPSFGGDIKPVFNALLGNPNSDINPMTTVPVALGAADEYNRQGPSWLWAQVDPGGSETPEHWSKFNGWDVLVSVQMDTWNERTINEWKGRDEIRKKGSWSISFNGEVVYGGDPIAEDHLRTLMKIGRTIEKLYHLPVDWRSGDYRGQIEDRKVYYKETPAVLKHWMPDQGAIMIHIDGPGRFPPDAYAIEEDLIDMEYAHVVKEEILSPRIWWWRDRN